MLKDIIKVSLLVLVSITVLMYFFQRHLIYFPSHQVPNRQDFHATDMQEIHLKTSDGIELLSWYKAAQAGHPTLLYFHGNAGHIGFRMPLARAFINEGFGILLLQYRGFGGNQGNPTEEGLYTDARAAIQFLQQQGVTSQHLALFGESLGTGVAVKMAEEVPVCALVLQSPFTSLSAVARFHYPWLFLQPWDRFDSLSKINQVKAPLLILHGKQDNIVPFAQGLALYNQANQPKAFVGLENRGHDDLWDTQFVKTVIDFIKSNCKSGSY